MSYDPRGPKTGAREKILAFFSLAKLNYTTSQAGGFWKLLKIPRNFRKVLDRQPMEMLDITADHAYAVGDLPAYHRDPFDRMLVAQAKVEGLTLVSHDLHLKKYKIPFIEA